MGTFKNLCKMSVIYAPSYVTVKLHTWCSSFQEKKAVNAVQWYKHARTNAQYQIFLPFVFAVAKAASFFTRAPEVYAWALLCMATDCHCTVQVIKNDGFQIAA